MLNERYANLAVFYRARLLRIFPSYWLWLGITLAAVLAGSQLGHDIGLGAARDTFTALDLPGRLYVLASNLLIVGQEWQ